MPALTHRATPDTHPTRLEPGRRYERLIDLQRQGLDADSISQNTGFDERKSLFTLGTISPRERKGRVNQKLDRLSV